MSALPTYVHVLHGREASEMVHDGSEREERRRSVDGKRFEREQNTETRQRRDRCAPGKTADYRRRSYR